MWACGKDNVTFFSTRAIPYSRAHYGQGSGPILMDGVICYGNESSIHECVFPGFNHSDCTHVEDAGVHCVLGMVPICILIYVNVTWLSSLCIGHLSKKNFETLSLCLNISPITEPGNNCSTILRF